MNRFHKSYPRPFRAFTKLTTGVGQPKGNAQLRDKKLPETIPLISMPRVSFMKAGLGGIS